jgi:magnesium transporter
MNNLDLSRTTARNEIRRRAPWMLLGFVAGIVMVLVGDYYEEVLSKKIEVVFFIPMIVYMSDIIGTETLALFVRELALRTVELHRIFWREVATGLSLGLITGVPMGIFGYLWLNDLQLAITLVLTMAINGLVAVVTGMLAPLAFAKLKKDPALGTDEVTTAVSDTISMLIYLVIATLLLF